MLNVQEYQEYISLNETKKNKEKELEDIKKKQQIKKEYWLKTQ